MKQTKSEIIERYGEDAWEKRLAQSRAWYKAHRKIHNARVRDWQKRNPEKVKETTKAWQEANRESRCASAQKWRERHPEKVEALRRERQRAGGKYYEQMRKYESTGLPKERKSVRRRHAKQYHPFKMIIAPDSEIHHEWVPETAEYTGLALVETNPHRYGIIDVIQILDGRITILTEKEVKGAS